MALVLTVLAALSWDGCTAASLGNAPLAHWEPEPARASPEDSRAPRSDELLLILAFSGGGTRAAAFAYGILEELAATPVVLGGQSRRLLDEVDLISSVSGGSFTAAYYGLYGDRIFRDFETDFLRRPVERELFVQLLRPYNWVRLASPFFNRSRLAAEYYDEHLFRGATFADLERQPGPGILINATDLSTGSRFAFNRFFFDPICSDLSRYHVAQAVTASSAVPVLLTPVTLENRAGACGYQAAPLAGRPEYLERGGGAACAPSSAAGPPTWTGTGAVTSTSWMAASPTTSGCAGCTSGSWWMAGSRTPCAPPATPAFAMSW